MLSLSGSIVRIRDATPSDDARAHPSSRDLDDVDYAALSSAELVAHLRAADRVAADELWSRYARRVRALLRRILGADAELEDLMQEVFLELFKGIRRLRDDSKLTNYVLGVTANMGRNALRKRARARSRVQTDKAPTDLASPGHDPHARRALRRLEAILDDLTPDLRVSFVLRHVEGLELQEVASAMSWSLATTKRRLRKAQTILFARARQDELLRDYVTYGGAP